MRIVQVTNALIPSRFASAVQVLNMGVALARAGHDVRLLGRTRSRQSSNDPGSILESYGLPSVSAESLRLDLQHQGRSGPLPYLRHVRAVSSSGPDLVYSRHIMASLVVPRSVPQVLELHAIPHRPAHRAALGRLLHRHSLVRVVVISRALAGDLADQFSVRAPIVVAHDASGSRAPGNRPGSPAPRRYQDKARDLQLYYVGQLYPGKGLELLKDLAPHIAHHALHIVGGSPSDIAHWTREFGDARVTFHGHVDPKEVPQMLADADVAVLSNQRSVRTASGRGDIGRWTSPLKMFDYLHAGLPIIASDLPVLREVLTPGVNALLAGPQDANAWAEAVRALESGTMRERLARGALATAARFTWGARVRAVLDGVAVV